MHRYSDEGGEEMMNAGTEMSIVIKLVNKFKPMAASLT